MGTSFRVLIRALAAGAVAPRQRRCADAGDIRLPPSQPPRRRPPASLARPCAACGAPEAPLVRGLCVPCLLRYDAALARLGRVLDEQPDASLAAAQRACGLTPALLVGLMNAGRVLPLAGAPDEPACDLCRAPIARGLYCAGCQRRLEARVSRGVVGDHRCRGAAPAAPSGR